jgi:MoxR-like ATPase
VNTRLPVIVRREATRFVVQPVFGSTPDAVSGPTLTNATERLLHAIGRTLADPTRTTHPAALLASCALEPCYLRGRLDLRGHKAKPFRLLVLRQQSEDGELVHVPSLGLVFQREASDSLVVDVAANVARCLERRQRTGSSAALPELADGRSSIWLDWLPLRLEPVRAQPGAPAGLLALFGDDIGTGAQELAKTSTALERLDPARELRCLLRDDLLALLERRLRAPERGALLLLGESGCGKSALVRELALRRTERQRTASEATTSRGAFWHLAPANLIAGMMYQGQWERRLERILAHAEAQDLVLWFDDLLGLTTAGRASGTTMVMADVLQSAIAAGRCRVLGEITGGAWRLLRERHRALAEAFEIVRMPAVDTATTRRLCVHVAQALERCYGVQFDFTLFQGLTDHVARVPGGRVEPGRSLDVLQALATQARSHRGRIDRSRLAATAVLPKVQLDQPTTERVLDWIGQLVRGQPAATAALLEAIQLADLGLGDPERPIRTMLFTGPTGVGKTESAKALVRLLFADERRHLLRFDMNQYASYAQAQRLIGTFDAPDGHLTAAVRSTPAAVVLLDEIEKAHATVHDLLLQVLGEGRLTDARGRTVDFRQTIVVMTSNLGAVEARDQIVPGGGDAAEVYRAAVRRFFRPEFTNRIDRIVPFRPLDRNDIQALVTRQLELVQQRSGLQRRKVYLALTPAARELLVDLGFHPQLGARALQRAIADHVLAPLAEPLAASTDQDLVWLGFAREGRLVGELRPVPPCERWVAPDVDLTTYGSTVDDVAAALLHAARELRRRIQQAVADGVLPSAAAGELEALVDTVASIGETGLDQEGNAPTRVRSVKKLCDGRSGWQRQHHRALLHYQEIDEELALHGSRQRQPSLEQLHAPVRVLRAVEQLLGEPLAGRVLVHCRGLFDESPSIDRRDVWSPVTHQAECLGSELVWIAAPGVDATEQPLAFVCTGVLAVVAQHLAGGVGNPGGACDEIVATPLADDEDPAAVLAALQQQRRSLLVDIEQGRRPAADLVLPPRRWITKARDPDTIVDVFPNLDPYKSYRRYWPYWPDMVVDTLLAVSSAREAES